MTWAKVCDTLHGHPKALDAGLEAMGLWVRALSHCAAYGSNGHVRRSTAVSLAGTSERAERLARRLVRARLWELHASGDGWQVHDYLDCNPTRDAVLAEKAAKREGGRRGAANRWGKRDGITHSSTHGVSHGVTHGVSHGVSHASGNAPVPSRPEERDLSPAPQSIQDSKGVPPTALVRAEDRVQSKAETERRRAEQNGQLDALKRDPSYAPGSKP
jgi:hypothetical protein